MIPLILSSSSSSSSTSKLSFLFIRRRCCRKEVLSSSSSSSVVLGSTGVKRYYSCHHSPTKTTKSLFVGKQSRTTATTITKTQQLLRLSSLAADAICHHHHHPTIIMDDTTTASSASSTSTTTTDDDVDNNNIIVDIEDLHQQALNMGSKTYIDPTTGFTVFTELCHLQRGFCCGNSCRHCPYGYENVKKKNNKKNYNNNKTMMKQQQQAHAKAKVKSGDMETTQRMVQDILKLSSSSSSSTTTTTKKNVPYTRKGDRGTSQLGTGERRSKDDANFEALGTIDELCSFVGVAHASLDVDDMKTTKYGDLSNQLLDIMSRLFDVGSHVAKPNNVNSNNNNEDDEDEDINNTTKFQNKNGIGDGFDSCHIDDLECWINEMTEIMPELTSFILPSGSITAAHLHVARTVCRRAERRCVTLVVDHQTCDPNALKYLNRLSDYFFTASRYVNYCENQPEIQYVRSSPNSTQRQRVSRSLQQQETKTPTQG